MPIRRIKAEHELGALTAFADINGLPYGISAAHVLTGGDRSIDRTEHIDVYEEESLDWLPGGITQAGHDILDTGRKPDNYGIFDAGIFSLSPVLSRYLSRHQHRFLNIHPALLHGNPEALTGETLFSYSGMSEKDISGVVDTVFGISGRGNPYDLVIISADGSDMILKGDSGTLWVDANGNAVGLHISGNGVDSPVSFSMFIHRVVNAFRIQGLYIA